MKQCRKFSPSPRLIPKVYREKIRIEPPPPMEKREEPSMLLTIGPSMTMALPMLLGCLVSVYGYRGQRTGTFLYMGLITAGSAALLGTFWAFLSSRRSRKVFLRKEEERQRTYREYIRQIEELLKERSRYNTAVLHRLYPSAEHAALLDSSCREFWSRTRRQEDYLYVRLGLGKLPFQSEIEIPERHFRICPDPLEEEPERLKNTFEWLYDVPVGIRLREQKAVGLLGGQDKRGAEQLMHVIAAQLTAYHSTGSIRMFVIWDECADTEEAYMCMRYYPHIWSEDRAMRFLAGSISERRDLFFYLSERLRRQEEDSPHLVIFVSNPDLCRETPLEKWIRSEESMGITVFFLAGREAELPDYVDLLIENSSQKRIRYADRREEGDGVFVPDKVTEAMLLKQSRKMALVPAAEGSKAQLLPLTADFLEIQDCRTVEELRIRERWNRNRASESLQAVLGAGEGGRIRMLDLHEKCHGPHGILAGATGSGKSVLIQTFLLSMAVNYSPREIVFFLIDYKGGGTADGFEGLPHLAGKVSNLSGREISRALLSVKSESIRRQRLLAACHVNHIDQYAELYRRGMTEEPLPHLLLLIDEFAELKKEEPQFMQELISLSQVGRSLGIHLLMAAQKPAGTVSENIWSNARFHICLRVQSTADSRDMLRHPDAAAITQVGRGFLQVGQDEIYEEFQTAYCENRYEPGQKKESAAELVRRNGSIRRLTVELSEPGEKRSVREAVIQEIMRTAEETEETVRQLWMPELPKLLTIESLRERKQKEHSPEQERDVALRKTGMLGLVDDPENQQQTVLEIDFQKSGYIAVLGEAESGRTTFLETLIGETLQMAGEWEIRIFAFGGRKLRQFAGNPRVQVWSEDTEEGELQDVFTQIGRRIAEGKRKDAGEDGKRMLIVMDNIGSLRTACYETDRLLDQLLRDGKAAGIYLAVSASGFGMNELPMLLNGRFSKMFCLDYKEEIRYMEAFHGLRPPKGRESGIHGRGLLESEGRLLEFQTAVYQQEDLLFTMANRKKEVHGWRNSV